MSVRPAFRPDVEGLRAVAVVLVVLGHAAVPLLDGGFVGVDVFLVISGFLITRILLDECDRDGRPSLLRFYAHRVRRILPMAVLVALVTVVASYALVGPALGDRVAVDAAWAAVFLANVHLARDGVDYFQRGAGTSPLEHYWSLGVEEQFYLVWPLLVLLVALVARSPRGRRLALGAVLGLVVVGSLAWSVHQTAAAPTAAYFSPLTRAHELALGGLLAVTLPRLPAPAVLRRGAVPLGLLLVLGSALALGPGSAVPGATVLVPALGAVLVIGGGARHPVGATTRLLGSAPLRFVGRRSYGFYLWHLPLLVLPATLAGEPLAPLTRALLVLAAFALSCVSFALLEEPVRRSPGLRRRSPALSLALGLALVATGLGGAQVARATQRVDAPARPEVGFAALPTGAEVEREVAAAARLDAVPDDVDPPVDAISRLGSPVAAETVCDRTEEATAADACFFDDVGDGSGGTTVVWGDSHAAMWLPALREVARQEDQRLGAMIKYGCAPLLDVLPWHPTDDRPYDTCPGYAASAVARLLELRPDTIVLSGAYGGWSFVDGSGRRVPGPGEAANRAWTEGLTRAIDALRPTGARIVVLGDLAYQQGDESVCLAVDADDVARCTAPREVAVLAEHNAAEQDAATAAGASYVPVVRWLCTDAVCPPVVAGTVVYRDAAHLTRQYARRLARAVGEAAGLLER